MAKDYFEKSNFDEFNRFRILGPPAMIAASISGEGLPSHNRPIYNYSMRGVVTAFTGIRKRDELVSVN